MLPSPADVGATAGPVFVDRSGRRRRAVKRLGVAVVSLGVAYGATLVLLATTGIHIDAPGLPLIEQPLQRATPTHARSAREVTPRAASKPPPTALAAPTTARTTPPIPVAAPSPAAPATPASPATTQASPVSIASAGASATGAGALAPGATSSPTPSAAPSTGGKSASAPGATRRPSPRAETTTGGKATAPGRTRRPA